MKNKAELIKRLKEARIQKEISYQAIVNKTEEMGCAVSLSSVRRVFTESNAPESFRYDDTLKPIACVVLGLDFEDATSPKEEFSENKVEEYFTEAQALRAIVEIKNTQIEELKDQLADARASHQREVSELHKVYQNGIKDRVNVVKSLVVITVCLSLIILILVATLAYIDYTFFPTVGLLKPGV